MHAQQILQFIYKGKVQRRIRTEHPLRLHFQISAKRLNHRLIDLSGHIQAHRRQLPAFFHQVRHELAVIQILIIQRIRIDIRISHHTDQGFADDLVSLEYFTDIMEHDVLGQDKSSFPARDLNQTFHHIIGAGNDADPLLAASRLQDNHRVDLLIAQEREWLTLAHDSRRA